MVTSCSSHQEGWSSNFPECISALRVRVQEGSSSSFSGRVSALRVGVLYSLDDVGLILQK